ncbi:MULTISPECIES: hypothetical protein [Saccharothrix]|uniref:hypothetical protein n=1 Tax=Saccharothrix TaxID=2071 RepID=UPI00093B9A8D|nr:hypothetical protein [Saccharothrix sp. CB00851]
MNRHWTRPNPTVTDISAHVPQLPADIGCGPGKSHSGLDGGRGSGQVEFRVPRSAVEWWVRP